jgi:hypothetical protein
MKDARRGGKGGRATNGPWVDSPLPAASGAFSFGVGAGKSLCFGAHDPDRPSKARPCIPSCSRTRLTVVTGISRCDRDGTHIGFLRDSRRWPRGWGETATGDAGRFLLTLTQVLELERPAWHEDGEFSYDGIDLWRDVDGSKRATQVSEAPQSGWRHAPDCHCSICR